MAMITTTVPKIAAPNQYFSTRSCRAMTVRLQHYGSSPVAARCKKLVDEFKPNTPIEKATTPPSSWYTDPSFFDLELLLVFYRGWQAVGYTEQIKNARDFFTGRLGNVEFVVCRDDEGNVRAFHNVCRHHASLLASGSGQKSCFVCPYHGWTYGLDGALLKATRITGIQNFDVNVCRSNLLVILFFVRATSFLKLMDNLVDFFDDGAKEFGLASIAVTIWGPFILLNLEQEVLHEEEVDINKLEKEWLGSCSEILSFNGIDSSLSYVCRRIYDIECNWKVFCDNYLDGGYHVPYAHKDLASGLKLDSYSTEIYETVSIQRCKSSSMENEDDFDRLGSNALYAFIYPNFMINRYGPWMDTNLVLPLGPRKCQVIFDYFIEAYVQDDKAFIDTSLIHSERVQMEDIMLCEGVQRGLESPAYHSGRYAPRVENAMHHFHGLLHKNLVSK